MLGDTRPYEISKTRRYSLDVAMQNYSSGRISIGYNLSEIMRNKYELMYKPGH